jgi:hypothetical protein
MFDVLVARAAGKTALDLPDNVFAEQIRQGMNQGPGADAPRVMRTSLVAPYIYGTLFVHALRRRGGWAEVDRAWDNAPATSEQILHVDKWLAREPPLTVTPPTFASLGPGWTVADEDSEGELGTRIAFEEWMNPGLAADASAGWGGDRGVLVTNGNRSAFAWRLRYDEAGGGEARASRAQVAIDAALSKLPGRWARTGSFACRERADRGPIALMKSGAELILALGPAVTGARPWTSAGDCALAQRWAREIAAAK